MVTVRSSTVRMRRALDGTRRWQTTTDISIGGTVETLERVGDTLVVASDNELAAYIR